MCEMKRCELTVYSLCVCVCVCVCSNTPSSDHPKCASKMQYNTNVYIVKVRMGTSEGIGIKMNSSQHMQHSTLTTLLITGNSPCLPKWKRRCPVKYTYSLTTPIRAPLVW